MGTNLFKSSLTCQKCGGRTFRTWACACPKCSAVNRDLCTVCNGAGKVQFMKCDNSACEAEYYGLRNGTSVAKVNPLPAEPVGEEFENSVILPPPRMEYEGFQSAPPSEYLREGVFGPNKRNIGEAQKRIEAAWDSAYDESSIFRRVECPCCKGELSIIRNGKRGKCPLCNGIGGVAEATAAVFLTAQALTQGKDSKPNPQEPTKKRPSRRFLEE